jgi:hypothetical protein
MKSETSFSNLPFEITREIVISVIENSKFDYLRRPCVCYFMELAETDKKYLYIYPVMLLKLVSKSFKKIVDSIIIRVLEIQSETPVISYLNKHQFFMGHFGVPQTCTSNRYPFRVAGLVMDHQFNDMFGIMSRDERPQVFLSRSVQVKKRLISVRLLFIHLSMPEIRR